MGIQLALPRIASSPHIDNLYIFTDSQFTLGVLTKGHQVRAAATTSLLNALKLLISTIPPHVKLNVIWIPAHLDISENEHAASRRPWLEGQLDWQAKRR